MADRAISINARVSKALTIAVEYGTIDGAHHKAWVVDQMVRALAGYEYERIINEVEGETGIWDVGIAP